MTKTTKTTTRAAKILRIAGEQPAKQGGKATKTRLTVKSNVDIKKLNAVVAKHAEHALLSKRPRITKEQLTEMRKLAREGNSMSAIARTVGCHRQTVERLLAEPKVDSVAEEARKEVLTAEFRSHFADFSKFTERGLKSMLDASPPDHEDRQSGDKRSKGPVLLGVILGLPHAGDANYMSREWTRMYRPPSREAHLLQALREHTPGFSLWEPFDAWRKRVAEYEKAGSAILRFLENKIEWDLYDVVDPAKLEAVQAWAFGSILRLSVDLQPDDLKGFRKNAFDPKGVILARDEGKDADGSGYLYDKLTCVLTETQKLPEFPILKSAATDLMRKESQLELRRIVRDIDRELATINLMHALPGRCHLCPV